MSTSVHHVFYCTHVNIVIKQQYRENDFLKIAQQRFPCTVLTVLSIIFLYLSSDVQPVLLHMCRVLHVQAIYMVKIVTEISEITALIN